MNAVTEKTRLGLGILGAALVLGVLGDAILRPAPWGLNVLLWVGALVVSTVVLVRWSRLLVSGGGRWLVLPLLFFAAAFAWRDSPTLKALNGLALLSSLALAAARTKSGRIRVAGITEWLLGGLLVSLSTMLGMVLLLFGDIRWNELARDNSWYRPLKAVARGLVLATPLLLLFGGLFVAADAVFGGLVADLFRWDLGAAFTHLFLIALLTWIVAGMLRATLLAQEWADLPGGGGIPISLGIIEIVVVLGLLDVLFLVFVSVQVRYFFGGAATVVTSTGLTYAEYARRGFFELVTVTTLVLPLLLLAHWIVRKENPVHERIFRFLAGTLVALLLVVMASALQRMRLYQEAYGLTELRFYTTSFMGWLAVVFLWFLATVLRGQRDRFAFGALVAGFIVLALLDGANPDALIARTNANRGRANTAAPLDERYVTSLSADAVPTLIAMLPVMSEDKRPAVAKKILARWSPPESQDWRTWNWGRTRAWQAVDANQATLEALAR